jgi:hypothetical protein
MTIASRVKPSKTHNDHAVFMNLETFIEGETGLAMPEGVIAFIPGTIFDEIEGHGIIDFKVALGPDVVKGVLTASQARSLRRALDWAIKHAKDEEPGNPVSEGMRRVYSRAAEAEPKIDWSADGPESKKENPLQQLFEYQAGGYPVGRAIIVSSGDEHPNPCVIGFIADEELDVVKVEFDAEGGIELKTDDLTYVSLMNEQLYQLLEMGDQAEELFKKLEEFPTDEHGRRTGWENLITHPREIEASPTNTGPEAPSETGQEA